jgi:hypothetical protein
MREVFFVKSTTLRSLAVAVSLLLLAACGGRESKAPDEATATIAPAQPQPAETGTDAMTQTVELGDGRSVSEGGAAASDDTTATDTASAPMTENPTTTTATTTTR